MRSPRLAVLAAVAFFCPAFAFAQSAAVNLSALAQQLLSGGIVPLSAGGTGVISLTANDCLAANASATAFVFVPCGGGGSSMTWPTSAGIANYSGSSSWLSSYNASNPIPANFLSPIPINTGVSGLGTGVASFLIVPSATNLGAAVTGAGLVAGANITITGTWPNQTITASSSASTAFSALAGSTNTTASMLVGTGASLGPTGAGIVNANQVNGATVPAGATVLATNVSNQVVAATTTGSGSVVLSTSPTLVTPSLGIPSALTLTNASGLPLAGITGFGTGVSTFLATPSSANLAAAVTGETGSGALVFGTSPTLTTPNIGAATGTSLSVSGQLTSTVVTGTAPLVVSSTTPVTNLNIGGNAATATALSTTGGNGTFWGVSGGVQGYFTPSASASSVTPGTTTVVGATAPCLLDNSASTTMGCAALGNNLSITAGVLGSTVPNRTVTTSPTVASTDMGGVLIMNVTGGGTMTVPAISSTVFANGMSLLVINYSASTAAVSTTPTINSGGGCVSAAGIPAGDAWQMLSNGTTIDCTQTIPSASGGGTPSTPAFSVQYDNAGAFGGVSLTAGTVLQGTGTGAAPTATATPTLGASGTLGSLTFGNATSGTVTLQTVTGALGAVTASLPANTGTIAELNAAQTFSVAQIFSSGVTFSRNPVASTAAVTFSGNPFTGGTGTTTFPLLYFNQGGTAPTTFNTNGTEVGFNAPSAFAGNFVDFHVNGGASLFAIDNGGNVTGGTYNGTTIPSSATLTKTIASGTATLGTTAIASGACATVVTVSATGVATTDVVKAGFNGDPTAVTGYGASATGAVLTIYPYPTANNINVKVCNSTSASITPGAMTLNWSVTR